MDRNQNANRDTIDDISIPSERCEIQELRSLVVPAARPTEPAARAEVSLWSWPTSDALPSDEMQVGAVDAAEANRLTETGSDTLLQAEPPALHDTLPSPPPSTDYRE